MIKQKSLHELEIQFEKNNNDAETQEWLETVDEDMYNAATALQKMVVHNLGTKGKMIIARAFEQIIAQERAKLDFPGDAPEARS